MSTLTLLSLPDELLIQILLHLPPSDLLATQLTSHYLNTTVTHSVLLQYRTLLTAAQYTDNPSSPLSISDRLAVLKRREAAWSSLRPSSTKEIELQHRPCGVYDITGGVYLSGDEARRNLFWVQLPAQEGDEPEWRTVDMGPKLFVVDMGLCVYEHDLIGVVTTSPHPSEFATYTTELHLLQFSASSSSSHPTPHPLATQNPLHILDSRHERSSIGLEIVGDHLILILLFPLTLDEPDRVFVYHWRSGHVVARLSAPHGSYYGLVFLTEHLFLLPNAKEGRFEVYEIPTRTGPDVDGAVGIELTPIHILALPALAEGRNFANITCRGEPNPIGEGSLKLHTTIPCYPSPEDAIIIFTVRVRSLPQGPGHPMFLHAFSVYVHRSAVLEVCRKDSLARSAAAPSLSSTSDSTSPLIPYRAWGPPITRWFNADQMASRWITTTAGQRAVIPPIGGEHLAPYIVLDFNQGNVERAKKVLRSHTWNDSVPWSEAEDEDEIWQDTDEDEDEQNPALIHPLNDPAPLPPTNRWIGAAFHPVHAINLFDPSEEPVGGLLPYVACSSTNNYAWDGILMDGERVVGIVTDSEGQHRRAKRVQVNIFG